MIVFIVPVKSATVSSNWDVFSKLFERTIRSICQQTDSAYKAVAVCHEKPRTDFLHENFEYLEVDFDPPKILDNNKKNHNALREVDKSKKILAAVRYVERYQPSHLMVVDSDDCISKNIAYFVNKANINSIGWYLSKGYIYKEGNFFSFLNKINFNTLCGSCIIIKSNHISALFKEEPFLYYSHERTEIDLNKKLIQLPFPGAVYSIGNGENHLMSIEQASQYNSTFKFGSIDFFKSIFRKLTKYRLQPLTASFRSQYGLYKL